jgi:hypothetical protein
LYNPLLLRKLKQAREFLGALKVCSRQLVDFTPMANIVKEDSPLICL